MSNYKVASEEGAQRYGAEVGQEVTLKLSQDEERAVVAAGWLEKTAPPKKKGEN